MIIKDFLTVEMLAKFLSIPFKGDGNQVVTGINEIHKVRNGDITFVDIEKYYDKALNSQATIIIINKEVPVPIGKSILISNDPFSSYQQVVKRYCPEKKPSSQKSIDGAYFFGENVQIGDNTIIHPGVVIGNNISIGDNCIIYPNTVIYDQTTIGNNVIIHANCVIGGHAFYYKKRPSGWEKMISCGCVFIEDEVEIGASCTIDKGVSGETIIKKGVKLDNHIHIGHGVIIGERTLIAAQSGVGGKTIIEEDVLIWGQVGVTKDVTIGKGAVLLAQTGVSKSLEGGKIYFGSPAEENRKKLKELSLLRNIDDLVKRIKDLEDKLR